MKPSVALVVAALLAGLLAIAGPADAIPTLEVAFDKNTTGWVNDGHPRTQCFIRSGVAVCRAESRYINGAWQHDPDIAWRDQLANGDYRVTVRVGDPAVNHRQFVRANGVQVIDEYNERTTFSRMANVTVTDGWLTLTFGPSESRTAINQVHAEPIGANSSTTSTTSPVVSSTTQTPATTTSVATEPPGGWGSGFPCRDRRARRSHHNRQRAGAEILAAVDYIKTRTGA